MALRLTLFRHLQKLFGGALVRNSAWGVAPDQR